VKAIIERIFRKAVLPFVPARYKLNFIFWLERKSGKAELELFYLDRICSVFENAIDVGANIGYYSLQMSKLFKNVYSFELNEELTVNLKNALIENIAIMNIGLSNKDSLETLYIPIKNGIKLFGWASLQPNNCPDTNEHLQKAVRVKPLDSFSLRDISFMKIDVEGHEVEVLEGAINTIFKYRPVVLIEVKEVNLEKVFNYFKSLNYKVGRLEDFVIANGGIENFIFTPL
jgi:FkbM family methyltransferase